MARLASVLLGLGVTVWALLACAGGAPGLPRLVPTSDADEYVVTVLYFDNHTGDAQYAPLGKGIADMMVTDLAGIDGLRVVERARLEDLLAELELQTTAFFDPDTAVELGRGLGATHAVTGAISAVDPQMRIDVRLVDVATAEVAMADKVVGDPERFFALQEELAAKFVAAIDASMAPPVDNPVTDVPDVRVLLQYAEALDRADGGNLEAAQQVLRELVERNPGFGLAQVRYEELLAQVHAARARRDRLLGGDARRLLEMADDYVAQNDVTELGPKAAGHWLEYRRVRGQLLEQAAAALFTEPSFPTLPRPVPREDQAAYAALLRADLDNARELVRGIAAYTRKRGRLPSFPELPDEADALEARLSLPMGPGRGAVPIVDHITRVVCEGNYGPAFPFGSTPTLVDLEPTTLGLVLAMIDHVDVEVVALHPSHVEGHRMTLLESAGDCLMAAGRRAEALAKWQRVLDEHPRGPASQYEAVEHKLKEHL